MVFQQKLLEKAYFNVEMTGPAMVRPATQFWLLESAFSTIKWPPIKNDHFRKQQPMVWCINS